MNDSVSIRVVCRLYAAMLYGYPREFRLRYGVEMQQFFRDRCRELLRAHSGSGVWFRFGLRTVADWIPSSVREIKSNNASLATPRLRDFLQVEGLSGGVVHPAEKDQRDRIAFAVNERVDVFITKA